MRKKILLFLSVLMTVFSVHSAAQTGDYAMEIQAGKKYLNVEELRLAPSTKLSELLEMFPELLARDDGQMLDNYDLQLNDVSTGSSKSIVLIQLTLSDIDKIEVSQTPSAGQQKNGQGGVINVKLKSVDEGLSGKAMLGVGTLAGAVPLVGLNWRKGAWTLRGSAMMEYYHPLKEYTIRENISEHLCTYRNDSSDVDTGYEMASVDAVFAPDQKNKLHLWAWENYTISSKLSRSDVEVNSVSTYESDILKERTFSYLLGANYNHKFEKSEAEVECTYESAPGVCEEDRYHGYTRVDPGYMNYSDNTLKSKFACLAKYKYDFIPNTPRSKASLTGGVNFSLTTASMDYSFRKNVATKSDLQGNSSLSYISPYIETDNILGKWFLKASARYQHYLYDVKAGDGEIFERPENYFTGFLSAGYQIAPHHHISIILDRSVVRGTAQQMYPYKLYDPSQEIFTQGNPLLLPVKTNSVSANYITDFESGSGTGFTFDVELKYMNNTDLISSTKDYSVITYDNDGYSNIGAANLLFGVYGKVFSLSITANLFDNWTHISGVDDQYLYYNVSAVPSLKFNEGWVVSAKFTYNSHVYTRTSRLSDYIYAMTRFSKTWNAWTVYLELYDNFHDFACDEFYGEAVSEKLWYNLHRPSLGLGFHFAF